jgi:protein-export membrane protein SecD/preprotein translocase SecF subunit
MRNARFWVLVGVVATTFLLLFLHNKVWVGTQDLTLELRQIPAAPAAAADAPVTWEILVKDAAGNPRPVEEQTEWDVVAAEINRRLGERPSEKAIPLAAAPVRGADQRITFQVPSTVRDATLRSRLVSRPVKIANPTRELFHLNRGIDIRGGVEFICSLRNQDGEKVAATEDVLTTLRSRLDQRGLTEPVVTRMSNGDVQVVIPGGTKADAARTRKVLETTGRLEFREVLWPYTSKDRGMAITADLDAPGAPIIDRGLNRYARAPNSDIYINTMAGDIIAADEPPIGERPTTFYRLGPVRLSGSDVNDAQGTTFEGQLAIAIDFSALGAGKNEEFTKTLHQQDRERGGDGTGTLAILFDGVIKSTAHVKNPSSGSCMIHGRFTQDDIENLRTALKGGSLAVTPEVLSERVVGASLGEDAIDRTVLIRTIAFLAVAAFMFVYYRRMGLVANICLGATAFLIFGVLSVFDATITLPGLAGLVLIIGMAVDTNILIFERIREELKEEKGMKAAIEAGYDRAFLTIIDSHLTTLATAFILYWIGSGPVKGFGLTLMIGILVNLFSGVYIGRLLTDWLCRGRTTLPMAAWVPVLRLPYVRFRWLSYIFSIVTGVGGLAWFAAGHHVTGGTFERNFDIDFTGGSMVQVTFREAKDQTQIETAVRSAYAALPPDQTASSLIHPDELRIQAYYAEFGATAASRQWIFRVRDDEGSRIEAERRTVEVEHAGLLRDLQQARNRGSADPEVATLTARLAPIQARIDALAAQVSDRTEVFKRAIAGVFPGQITTEADEITAASWADGTLSLTLATLEVPAAADVVALSERMAQRGPITVTQDGAALTVRLAAGTAPTTVDAARAGDPLVARVAALLGDSPQTAALAQTGAELAEQVADTAAGLRITVIKPYPASEHFSGQVADRMKWQALVALALSMLAILAYVAARFEFRFGIGAVVALGHDVLMTIGIICALGIRIDLTVIAALLTIIGTSINETIIIYDRIRENLRKAPGEIAGIIDLSVAQTIPRTMLTAGTTIGTLVVLLIFGGDALYAFTATLLIGMLLGLYSSIFVAAPLLMSFKGKIVEPEVVPAGPDPSQGILAKTDRDAPPAP